MRELKVREIVDLVASEPPELENRIEKMFEWSHDRSMLISKALVGGAISLYLTFAYGVIKKEIEVSLWFNVVGTIAVALAIGYGLYRFWRARFAAIEYAETLRLVGRLRRVRGLLRGR